MANDGLTDAQRRAFRDSTELGCIARSTQLRRALIRKGLAVHAAHPDAQAMDWTPLGQQIRTALLETEK